jgi:rod shape-determining protein MreD
MNWLKSIVILMAAFVVVFLESVCREPRGFLGAQIDLLPAIILYASLSADIVTMTLVAVLGGLWFDALSANPLGVSILPLFAAGFLIYPRRVLILREQYYARFVLGLAVSTVVPVLQLLLLLTMRANPPIGWGTIWQLLVMSVGGGLLTPLCFWLLDVVVRMLTYRPAAESSFREDRQIQRGRN